MVSWESRTALSCERDRFVGGLPPLQWSYTFGWRSPAFTMVASFDGARIVGGLPPLQWSPRFVGGLPPLQWSPVLLSASRLYNAPPFSWRPLANIQWSSALLALASLAASAFALVPRFVGGLSPLQWSPALLALASLAAFRLYNGPPFCWRLPAFTMVPRFVGGLPPLQWSPGFVGGLSPLQWSSALLVASRLMPVAHDPPQRSTALLAVSRLYSGPPLYACVAHICVAHLRVARTCVLRTNALPRS